MNYWVISDTHYGHHNIIKLCNRPGNYEQLIFDSWCNSVKPEDTIIHIGDVLFRANEKEIHEKYIKPAPGRKILVRGNHDKKSNEWYMEHGWDFSCDKFEMDYNQFRLVFQHVPQYGTQKDEMLNHYWQPETKVKYICGHLHDKAQFLPNVSKFQYIVSLEQQGYKVQALNNILKTLRLNDKIRRDEDIHKRLLPGQYNLL